MGSGDKGEVAWLSYSLNLLSHLASLIIGLFQPEATERSSRQAPLRSTIAVLEDYLTMTLSASRNATLLWPPLP